MKYVFIILMLFPIWELASQQNNGLPDWDITIFPGNPNTGFTENKTIRKDSLGYIWTNNPSSIERFDGRNFKSYFTFSDLQSDNDLQLVHDLYFAENGDLYTASAGGLFRFNRDTDSFERLMEGFIPYGENVLPEFTSIAERDGKFYLGSFVGLYITDPSKASWQFMDLTPHLKHGNAHHSKKSIVHLEIDKYDPNFINIFGKTHYYQLDTRTDSISKKISFFPRQGVSVQKVKQVSPAIFYLATFGSGIQRLDTNKEELIPYYTKSKNLINNKEFRVTYSADFVDGKLIATASGDPIAFIDTATQEVIEYDKLGYRTFDFVHFDDDIYWCNMEDGLAKLEKPQYTEYPIDVPSTREILKIAINNNEDIVAIKFNNNEIEFYSIQQNKLLTIDEVPNGSNIIYDKYADEFLIETARGQFSIVDGSDLSFKRYLSMDYNDLSYNYLIEPDRYIVNNRGRVNVFDKSGKRLKYVDIPVEYNSFFQLEYCWLTRFDSSRVIIQNPEHFLLVDLEKERYKRYPEFNKQSVISSYTMDGKDLYTVKERNGVFKYTYDEERDTFILKTLDYTLPSFTTYGSALFQDSLIWLRNNDNFKVFNMRSERFVMHKNFPLINYSIYGNVNLGPTGAWIRGNDLIMKIDAPKNQLQVESINLENVETNNRSIFERNKIELQPHENTIKFKWSSPYYGSSRTLNYFTLLEGRDNQWENLREENEKLYLGLAPGKYTFRVKADAAGSEIIEEELFTFEILPPWYKTWWFYMIVAMLILGGFYIWYRLRLQEITKKNKLEKRIAQLELKALKAQLNPHFIFNSLNSIKRLIQKNDNKVAIEYLLLFSSMIRNVLDLSDKKSVSLREELEFSEQYLKMEKLRFRKNFDYEIYYDDEYFLDDYNLPAMILQPHLENAIWHGIMPLEDRNGKVFINTFETEDSIIIRIEDNGIGREASRIINEKMRANIHTSKGQSLSIDRLKLASLSRDQEITTEIIDKDPDSENPGTIVNIKLKKQNQ